MITHPPIKSASEPRRIPFGPAVLIGATNDRSEREADRRADHALANTATDFAGHARHPVRTDPRLAASRPVTSTIGHLVAGGGSPLEHGLKRDMEQRFGEDFSQVRTHTGGEAVHSAATVGARAYTLGNHIVFGEGASPSDRRLLAHELAHVCEGRGQDPVLRRQPAPKGPHTQPEEARLRVKITDGLEALKKTAIDDMIAALERGDRTYLEGLGLSSKEIDNLINKTPKLYEMTFGRAAEFAVEKAVRADPFLSQYIVRGPQGRVPRGVGKPDWRIETPSSSIPVDLMTEKEVGRKLEMWRRQWKRGKPKWYVEKGLRTTYERPVPGTKAPQAEPPVEAPKTTVPATETPAVKAPVEVPEVVGPELAQVAGKSSRLGAFGKAALKEAPGLVLQVGIMLLFPPKVHFHNDKARELSKEKLEPMIQDALAKQQAAYDKLLGEDLSKFIYANVTARLDYRVEGAGNMSGDMELYLADLHFVGLKMSSNKLVVEDAKFDRTASRYVTKQIIYSILLYEPPDKEWERLQKEYEECVRQHGTGRIPPAAGIEGGQGNPDEGPCIRPHMKPMEGP